MAGQANISIIMPCFNEADRIRQSVESVFKQQYSDFELIIVDDGSSDDSLAILSELSNKYSNLRFFTQQNSGAGPARNKGLKAARGNFIAFLDADDSWHPACLLQLSQKLFADPDAALVYCGWQNLGLIKNKCKPFIPPDYETTDKIETLLGGCRWPIHAALTRRCVINAVNGFDEQWTSCMDYDLWLRIASFNKIARVPQVLAYYHHHDGLQITKNRRRIALNHWKIQLKFIAEHPEIIENLGPAKIKMLTYGELLQRAYVSYWERDLETAHMLFRMVLRGGYFKIKDLKYLLSALMPYTVYKALILKMQK